MQFPVYIPFVDRLGVELLKFEGGEAELVLVVTDPDLNSWGVAHGGVIMTLLDVVMAHAARSAFPRDLADPAAPPRPGSSGVATVEMKTSFMRPGLGRLLAKGKLLTLTRSLCFCEGSILDAEGALVAHATGTFKMLRAMPAGGRRIERSDASD
jgi:uncharacterized protein (TIGR00369 family)